MNIENEKDLQVWLELYKTMIISSPNTLIEDCGLCADKAFDEYKKRAKAIEEAKSSKAASEQEDTDGWVTWKGVELEKIPYPFESDDKVEIICRNGDHDIGLVGEFWWKHDIDGSDIVKFKYVK